tara:strand:+ start:566 stop:982 length:417 start_codon:yes stop_codon:yes gene_type:complete
MAYLIDTNVLSELRKGAKTNRSVRSWADNHRHIRQCVSVISLGEIRRGIELLRKKAPRRCPAFEQWLSALHEGYGDDILPINEEVSDCWGKLMAIRTFPAIDAYLAATALVYGLTVVTRNTSDFAGTGVGLVNPWEEA